MTAIDVVVRPIGRLGRLRLLAPLANRDYRLVWFGESVSLLGDHFHIVALSWLVLGLTGSGLALGTVLLASAIPRGVFMLVGGVLSDRISPRTLVLGSNLVRAVLTTVVAALVLGAQIQLWQLAAVGVIFGTVDAVFYPAINTLIPRLVPAERLPAANALLQGTAQLAGTVGPALAGFAIAIIGVGAAFALDAASFVVAAVALWFVRGGATPGAPVDTTDPAIDPAAAVAAAPATETAVEPAAPAAPRPSMVTSLLEGVRAVFGDPVMRMLVVMSLAINLAFNGPIVVGLPWLVLVHFGGDAVSLGLLFAAFGAGSVIGVLVGGSLPRPAQFGWIVLSLLVWMGLGLAALGLAPSVPAAALVAVLIGTANGYVNVVIIAWVQGRTEPHLLGRTMSFMMLGSVVAAPLSLALAGALTDTQATAMFVAAGALVVVTALLGIASGLPRRMH
jgi:MFS family permease